MKRMKCLVPFVSAVLCVSSPLVFAGEQSSSAEKQMKAEGFWQETKIESLLFSNTNLNNFSIDVDVSGNTAVLDGYVDSEVEKDLAEEIAMSVDGIDDVENKLSIDKDIAKQYDNKSAVKDALITAKINVKLLANDELSALDIDVDTNNRVVTLSGEVDSDAKRDLAEKIAENIDNVDDVENEIEVMDS
ncbi:MAG: BON domain-containing protein [Rickettsiales bacterium]